MDDDHYCTHCGSEDLEAGELRASGREWTCRQCGNVFQRDEHRDDDGTFWHAQAEEAPRIEFGA